MFVNISHTNSSEWNYDLYRSCYYDLASTDVVDVSPPKLRFGMTHQDNSKAARKLSNRINRWIYSFTRNECKAANPAWLYIYIDTGSEFIDRELRSLLADLNPTFVIKTNNRFERNNVPTHNAGLGKQV